MQEGMNDAPNNIYHSLMFGWRHQRLSISLHIPKNAGTIISDFKRKKKKNHMLILTSSSLVFYTVYFYSQMLETPFHHPSISWCWWWWWWCSLSASYPPHWQKDCQQRFFLSTLTWWRWCWKNCYLHLPGPSLHHWSDSDMTSLWWAMITYDLHKTHSSSINQCLVLQAPNNYLFGITSQTKVSGQYTFHLFQAQKSSYQIICNPVWCMRPI